MASAVDVIVAKQKDGTYKATQNGRGVATGDTQNEAGWNAHLKKPDAAIIAQRVRHTEEGVPDEFRRIYPQKPKKS